ncbi:Histone promoter control protein 2 [Paramyrothecium foliicola]|nr:Histone promoter control protein 2 [Paramyrothecium foliicola]
MAAYADSSMRYDSSAGELSSPPSGSLSEPGSPSRQAAGRPPNPADMEEIVVGNEQRQLQLQQQGAQPPYQQYQTTTTSSGNGQQKRFALIEGKWVQLTAAGVPRKKPGRKPGTVIKPKTGDGSEQPKVRKPRKPRDPNAPPIQRKRKLAPASDAEAESPAPASAPPSVAPSPSSRSLAPAGLVSHQPPNTSLSSPSPSSLHHPLPDQRFSPKIPKREGYPGSMQSILNSDPPAQSASVPLRTSGQKYDPIRGNYDPVRETVTSHNPFSSTSGSPRAPSQMTRRSPSIASLIEPQAPPLKSPNHAHLGFPASSAQSRVQTQESTSLPVSPSQSSKPAPASTPSSKTPAPEPKKEPPPPPPPAQRIVVKDSNLTTISNGPVKKVSPKQKPHAGVSTPKTDNLDDVPNEPDERSILDFGKARPGEETEVPTIMLNIPIQIGETNKYVNFMRMAEDRYGWDALHPRLAANRDRKARIAAAAASLEKTESGRESDDEMSVDLSDGDASNPENGGTSGPDANAKPKKKRNFKEDQYDVDDDFVDDSELLWEAQAAASRDGFFVYSGPLVPEVEKPASGYVVLSVCALVLLPMLTESLVTMVHQSAGEAAEEVVEVEELRLVEPAVVAVAAALDLEAVQSPGNLALPNPKKHSASGRRPNGKTWPSCPRLPRMAMPYSLPPLPLL